MPLSDGVASPRVQLIKKKKNLSAAFQKTLKHTRFGRISVKCYYDASEQRLTVEILHAADIIALDANGNDDKGQSGCVRALNSHPQHQRRTHMLFVATVAR